MTIKELVEFTGRTDRTIRRWIDKASLQGYDKMSQGCDKMSQGYAIDYTIDDIEKILNAGSMSRDAVIILMGNARRNMEVKQESTVLSMNNQPAQNVAQDVEVMQMFADMMAVSLATALKPIYDRLDNVESSKPKQLALPSAPDIKPRALLRQLVNDYAHSINITPRESWNELYKQFYYRCNESIKTKAKNLKIIPLDYLENENKLLTACSIMKDLIG